MKERPILFSGEMVKAILDGRKTMTRRVIKPQPSIRTSVCIDANSPSGYSYSNDVYGDIYCKCPYGKVGDRLWVKTSHYKGMDSKSDIIVWDTFTRTIRWQVEGVGDVENCEPELLTTNRFKFLAGRFMPKWAARIWLEITAIRVERLQEITPKDAVLEGLPCFIEYNKDWTVKQCIPPVERFKTLWDSINAKRGFGWESNPWVWVVEFKRTTQC